jgi:hypothetical protein
MHPCYSVTLAAALLITALFPGTVRATPEGLQFACDAYSSSVFHLKSFQQLRWFSDVGTFLGTRIELIAPHRLVCAVYAGSPELSCAIEGSVLIFLC